MKLFVKIVILTGAIVILLKSCTPLLDTPSRLIGQPAPDFTLTMLSGQEVNMTEFRNGQPAMIFFWATWCPHCRVQLKELARQREAIEGENIKIILVDSGESLPKVKSYMEANEIAFDVFLDESTNLAGDYQIVGVPTFFFVDKEGIIRGVENSLPDNYREILRGFTL